MTDDAAPSPTPARRPQRGPKRLLSLFVIIAVGVVFGFVAACAFAAFTGATIGKVPALVVGLVFAWVLPLFLAVRATVALKRQGRPSLLIRLVQGFLVGVVQLTVFVAGFTQTLDSEQPFTAHLADASSPILGHVPFISGIVDKHVREHLPAVVDPNTTIDVPDAGPDAGPGEAPPANNNGLSPREAGRAVAAVAIAAQTTTGEVAVAHTILAFGGQHTTVTTPLTGHADKGAPTHVEGSVDGHTVVVLGSQHVLVVDKAGVVTRDAALSRGGKVADLELQTIRDIAIGPGGHLLAAVDVFDAKKNATIQALVARPANGAPAIVRRAGTARDIEDKRDGEVTNLTHGYAIKRNDGQGNVVVEEVVLDGGADAGTKLSGAQFTMNPRCLLVGRIDAPKTLAEIVCTGEEPSGIDGVSLQGFADAVSLSDGRLVFDANFTEDGPRGWLFSARSGNGVFAVAPELVGKDAPWSEKAPRLRALSIEPEGTFAFVRDGGIVLGALGRPADAHKGLVNGADVVGAAGVVGQVSRAVSPRVAVGGEWLFAHVEVLTKGGERKEALVKASRADMKNNKVELLFIEGGKLGDESIKSLFALEGHDEPLWGAP